jgi:hypothetical protein
LAVAIRTRVFVFTFFDFYLIWSVDFYLWVGFRIQFKFPENFGRTGYGCFIISLVMSSLISFWFLVSTPIMIRKALDVSDRNPTWAYYVLPICPTERLNYIFHWGLVLLFGCSVLREHVSLASWKPFVIGNPIYLISQKHY